MRVANEHENEYGGALSRARPREREAVTTFLVAMALFVAAGMLTWFRMGEAMDLRSDEATYVIESVALQRTGMTQWNGAPFLVHPPLQFAAEGLYLRLRDIGRGPLFDRLVAAPYTVGEALLPPDTPLDSDNLAHAIVASRYLVATFGALTCALLFLLGARLLDNGAGILAAVLFMVDPYTLWLRHLNLLEPLATLLGLAAVLFYYRALSTGDARRRRAQMLLAGVFLGLALLGKELAVLYVPALVLHAVLFRRGRVGDLLVVLVAAGLVYSLFPLWALLSGQLEGWTSARAWLFERLLGHIQDTGITRPGASVANTLAALVGDYWPWFVLLAIAAIVTGLFLYFYVRKGLRDGPAEFVSSFIIGCYGFFVVVWKVGGVLNEQFFYMAMPMVAMAVAYAALAGGHLVERALATDTGTGQRRRAPGGFRRNAHFALLVVLALLSGYNLGAWALRYGLGRDDSYAQVDSYLAETLPPGAGVLGRDVLDMYLLPKNVVYAYGYLSYTGRSVNPDDVLSQHTPYAILNGQSLLQGYGGANPGYYDFVRANGAPLYVFRGWQWSTEVYAINLERAGQGKPVGDSG